MPYYRQNSTGFLCFFYSAPGAGYTEITAMPGDTAGRITWWRDRCVDAALGQVSEWHPTLSGSAEKSTGKSGDGKNYLPSLYAPFLASINSGEVPTYSAFGAGDYAGPPAIPYGGIAMYFDTPTPPDNCYFAASDTTYNLALIPNSRWIASAWVRGGTSRQFAFGIKTSAGHYYSPTLTTTGTGTEWVRHSAEINLSASASTAGVFVFRALTAIISYNLAAFMLERKVDNGTDPSLFVAGTG